MTSVSTYKLLQFTTTTTHLKKDNKALFRRVRTEESMVACKDDLLSQDWEIIDRGKDIARVHGDFLRIFQLLYDKNCLIKKYCRKQKYSDRPWISKGLLNACKKKNTLYREFIKHRKSI